MRLAPGTLLTLDTGTISVYLRLEKLAGTRQVCHVTHSQLGVSGRSLRRIVAQLRQAGMSIEYQAKPRTYRVAWPSAVDPAALLRELQTYEAGRHYPITEDHLRAVRRANPNSDPEQFHVAVTHALLSAYDVGIQMSNLSRWLHRGVADYLRNPVPQDTKTRSKNESEQWVTPQTPLADKPDQLRKIYGDKLPPGIPTSE